MQKELKVVNYLGEKGNPSPKVREHIKGQAVERAVKGLGQVFGRDVVIGNDKALYVPLMQDTNGTVIYARFEMTVSHKDPYAEKTATKKTTKKSNDSEIDLPELD